MSNEQRLQKILKNFSPSLWWADSVAFYTDGGRIPSLNKKIYILASQIVDKEVKVDDDILDKFLTFVEKYSDGVVDNLWISTIVDEGETNSKGVAFDELSYLLDGEMDFLLNVISNYCQKFVVNNEKLELEDLNFSEKVLTEVSKKLFEVIEEGRLEDFIGNPVIAEISEQRFNFEFYNKQISNLISKRIREESFDFEIPLWAYEDFLLIKEEERSGDNRFNPYWGIPTSSKKIEDKTLKEKYISVIMAGVTPPPSFKTPKNVRPSLIQWPSIILKNNLTTYNDGVPDAREFLNEYKTLEDTKISTYQFKYVKNLKGQYSKDDLWVPAREGRWYVPNFFEGERKTTAEVIETILKNQFTTMILKIMQDLRDGDGLSQTVGRYFRDSLEEDSKNIIEQITNIILIDKEIARRIQFWNEISLDDDGNLTEEEEEAALSRALDAWAVGEAEGVEELTEEDIRNRQKFFKQCALLMNLPELRSAYDDTLRKRYQNKKLFQDRFYMAYCAEGGQEKLLSNMLTSANEQKLLEIPGHILSSLVPKVRLFKVTEDGDRITNTEFVFDATSKIDRDENSFVKTSKFLSEEFDKGSGCGLKEFSFEFNGTNPAEARNDIKATLKLYFQSFSDFIRERKSTNGKTYKYVDLIIQPTPDKNQKINGINVITDRQYEPSFYRIRADIGYRTDGIQDQDLVDAINVSNKTLFLNMVDHDIQFKNDGSVEISISYRAYLESLLKHPRLDALASPELIAKRRENANKLAEELSKKQCSKEQIRELQVSIAATETVILRRSLSSIIDRLRDRGVIYSTQVKEEDRKHFISKGFFRKCGLKTSISDLSQTTGRSGRNNADVGVVLNSDLPENSEDFNFVNSTNNLIQFFFFGDLLYTILDCVYEKDSEKLRKDSGFQNSKILLGSFEFDPFQITGVKDRVFNIAHIPISVDFFSRWFVDEVMAQKSTRKSFPVLNFMRSLTNQLIRPSLLETCVNRSVDKTLRFQTSQITAYSETNADPLKEKNKPTDNGSIGMEVMQLRKEEILPLKGGGNSLEPNYLFNYIVLSTAGSSLTYSGRGKYAEDIEQGRLHVNIGQNNGLVKSISLSKSDQQYIREARFFQQGIDGLLQLSAVYVATIEMFGNTLFYPGMEFFFNPYGLGGSTHFGSPTNKGDVANKLGIGGYHTITSVRSSITPGSFKTTVAGQQYYSGDGSGNPNLQGKGSQNKETDNLEAYVPENLDEDACETVILGVQNFNPDEQQTTSDNIEDNGIDREESDFREDNESQLTEEEIDPFGESELTEEDDPGFATSELEG